MHQKNSSVRILSYFHKTQKHLSHGQYKQKFEAASSCNPISNNVGNSFGNSIGNPIGNPFDNPIGNPIGNPIVNPIGYPYW